MLKPHHPLLAETLTQGSPIIRSALCTSYSSEISTVRIVWGKGYSVEGKIKNIEDSPTITREVYYANSCCKNSPSAKALPPPPYHWVLISRKQTKLRSPSSSEDVSFVSDEPSETGDEQCSEDGSLVSDVSYSNDESLVSNVEYEIGSEASDAQCSEDESKSEEDECSEDGFLDSGEECTEMNLSNTNDASWLENMSDVDSLYSESS